MIKKYINTNNDNTLTVGTSYLLDGELGIRERGLLTTMLLIEANSFSLKYLTSVLPEGECQISSTLKKLENAGYVVRIRKMINGRQEWDYIVADHKLDDEARNQSYRAAKKKEQSEKPQRKNLFQKKKNTEKTNTQTISSEFKPVSKTNEYTDNYESYLEIVKNNIGYDYLLDVEEDTEMVDSVLSIITDTVCCKAKYIRVCKQDMPAEVVKSIFLKLNEEHIRYVLENMRKTASNIGNIISYIRTSLYNAVHTLKMHITASVNNGIANEPDVKEKQSNNNKAAIPTTYSGNLRPLF